MKAGVPLETVPERCPTTTGEVPTKVPGQWDGTATATDRGLDAGVSQGEPILAAVTPGEEVVGPTPQTKVLKTQAPTGETPNPTIRIRTRDGGSQ